MILLQKQRGFTLIEVLLAIFIVGLIMVIGQQIIQNFNKIQANLAENQSELSILQRTFQRLQQDFAHIQGRSVRDSTGQQIIPAFQVMDEGQGQVLQFTRTASIGKETKILRIEYRLENNNFIRSQNDILDIYYNHTVNKKILLKKVNKITYQIHIKGKNQTLPIFPLPNNVTNPAEANSMLPDGIQITIQYQNKDKPQTLEWWFMIGN